MKDIKLKNGAAIDVEQVAWDQVKVAAYTHTRSAPLVVHISPRKNPLPDGRKQRNTFLPDFLLIRNVVRSINKLSDCRNQLFGFMYANLPSVNSLHAEYYFLERPLVHAELNRINRTLGDEKFPVIPQNYFASADEMMYALPFPSVAKMGHGHAGYGKMKLANHHDFEDFRTVVAMTDHYCTAEPFIVGDYDLRIQKIGANYRVFKRISVSGNWKTNTGSSDLQELELTERYKFWADEASQMLGGLDICTVDVIHSEKDNKEYILEVNGTASGLAPGYIEIDNQHIRDVVIDKMNAIFCP